ncbi:MAG: hypothetical protein J0H02_15185 [Armatimonadetes bacterium]|nr:hypothetical protein [Armatimonadota bacterium]
MNAYIEDCACRTVDEMSSWSFQEENDGISADSLKYGIGRPFNESRQGKDSNQT